MYDGRSLNDHATLGRRMPERTVAAQGEPDVLAGQPAFDDGGLELGVASPGSRVCHKFRDDRLRLGDGDAASGESAVEDPCASHEVDHGSVEGGVVVGRDGVERHAHERRLHDPVIGDGPIQFRRVEPRHPVPEPEVGRGRGLGLQAADGTHGLHRAQALALQQPLPLKRRPIQLTGGQLHGLSALTTPSICGMWTAS